MSLVSGIFEASPYVEVVARRIYWSSPWLVRLVNKRRSARAGSAVQADPAGWERIGSFLEEHGAVAGSLLIVHSSASALKPTGLSPAQIIDKLLSMVGSSGTLAMPAFPKYEEEPQGIDRMRVDVSDLEPVYDVQKSVPWTGVLPLRLMHKPGAVRSRYPLNTMVAVGELAQPMMRDNLLGDEPLPCGVHSSWKFCADHRAIIIALGVDMAHSLTMIHVAEDAYEDQWPVKDWYRTRKFRVIDGGSVSRVTVRERRPCWAAHYAERTLSRDLKRQGLMVSARIGGVSIEMLGAQELLAYLAERRSSAYPYFMIPRGKKRTR